MLPNVLHAQLQEITSYDTENPLDDYRYYYDVMLLVGSNVLVRLRADETPSYKDTQEDHERIIAETLRKYFDGHLSAM